jgi:hypothetical protein
MKKSYIKPGRGGEELEQGQQRLEKLRKIVAEAQQRWPLSYAALEFVIKEYEK